EFFFMEMNTRLQVEHPVTEMVTGVDLVEWQVRIAAGEELTVRQDDVVLTGHSVEARVYAEVPERNFMPSGGEVVLLDELPADSAGRVRVDSSLIQGLQISSSYDPMISKVIAWGQDRTEALDTLDEALAGYTALGIDTNVEYLRLLINDADVRAGRLDTGLIERKMPDFSFRRTADAELAAAALYLRKVGDQKRSLPGSSLWNRGSGWRPGNRDLWNIRFGISSVESVTVSVTGGSSSDSVQVRVENGLNFDATLAAVSDDFVVLSYNGKALGYSIASTRAGTDGRPTELFLGNEGWSCRLEVLSRESKLARVLAAVDRVEGAVDPQVRAPMPGTVVSVSVSNGDTVEAGQVLLSVEAMKMEHQLVAPLDGTVHISIKSGDLVKAGQVLATIHPAVPVEPSKAEDTIEEAVIAMGAAE
ncbi:biotin/lipoyl-containing protein, partial [Arthrobacter sp. RHLT1-20]